MPARFPGGEDLGVQMTGSLTGFQDQGRCSWGPPGLFDGR